MALLLSFDDFDDQGFIWGDSEPYNRYDAKIYDNQYDDSSKLRPAPFPSELLVTINKQQSERILSTPFSSTEYRPPPPNPPPA